MKRLLIYLLPLVLALMGWTLPVWSSAAPQDPAPVASPPPDKLADNLSALQKAANPSSVIDVYSKGLAIDNKDPRLYELFVRRMIDFGLPEMAFDQAQTLTGLKPDAGVGWGVIAYVNALQGNMPSAFSAISMAEKHSPTEPFVLRTAGDLTAWYEKNPKKTELSASMAAVAQTLQADLGSNPIYGAALTKAQQGYEQAAATTQPAQPEQQTSATPPAGNPANGGAYVDNGSQSVTYGTGDSGAYVDNGAQAVTYGTGYDGGYGYGGSGYAYAPYGYDYGMDYPYSGLYYGGYYSTYQPYYYSSPFFFGFGGFHHHSFRDFDRDDFHGHGGNGRNNTGFQSGVNRNGVNGNAMTAAAVRSGLVNSPRVMRSTAANGQTFTRTVQSNNALTARTGQGHLNSSLTRTQGMPSWTSPRSTISGNGRINGNVASVSPRVLSTPRSSVGTSHFNGSAMSSRSFSAPSRSFSGSAMGSRSFSAPSRSFSGSAMGSRSFSAPSRSFSAPSHFSGGGGGAHFSGGGGHMGGGGFGGGHGGGGGHR